MTPLGDRPVAITIDVESDWGGRFRPGPNHLWGIRDGLPRMLGVLDEAGIKCTLFVSAEVTEHTMPVLTQAIASGHEIASHGLEHRNLARLNAHELRRDLVRSKSVLEDKLGVAVLGFRSPEGAIHRLLFEILAESGYSYDSSMIGSFLPGRYWNRNLSKSPFWRDRIVEIPGSILPWLHLPMGLLWLNLLGTRSWQFLLRHMKCSHPVCVYAHPFDVLAEKRNPPANLVPRAWYGLRPKSAFRTFSDLINYFRSTSSRFVTLRDVYADFASQKQAGI